ncbi:MAG: AAA family ATPase [Marinifilaceae bacterium]|jgi:AAA15 family ATPase/GTPase|nr:AAA family ATPase [Marinifilaceae bacterium]
MALIKSINIKNYRGFDSLEIDDFGHVNILIGNNNSGKSTILESIFLTIGMSNPSLPDNVNRFRGLNIKSADEFKFLFHKLKINNNPEFKIVFQDESSRHLKLNPIFKKASSGSKQPTKTEDIIMDASTASPNMTGLELEFSLKKPQTQKKNYKSSIIFNFPEIIQNQNKEYKEEAHAVFLTGNSSEVNALARYSEIVKKKKGDIVLNALQKIDSNIESIHPLPDGLYFGYKDIDELIPSNISGDGVRKFLSIVTTIAEKPNSFILIDEIENGLHYSAHKSIWESIITISKEFNTQLFVTSHNLETLTCLKEILELQKYKDNQEDLRVYTVTHTKKAGVKTYKYTYNGFKNAIENQTELRR